MQTGFRKQLETFVREAFIRKQHAIAVFFDLEKVYYTTWKYGIMQDVFNAGLIFNCKSHMLHHKCCNFSRDTNLQFKIGDGRKTHTSMLAQLLFTVNTDDLKKHSTLQ